MTEATGSFFDKDAVIAACTYIISEEEEARKQRKLDYCVENRYQRQFPKFWVIKKLTDAEILKNAEESKSIHNWDWYELNAVYSREHSAKSLLKLAERADGRIYVTRRDFQDIAKYMPKTVKP